MYPRRLALLVLLCLGVTSRLVAAPASRPNLIAIVTDDQGRWALGAYGNKEIHTPNLDRLAQQGALFTRAFTNTPVCSPSRATYLTGLYPTEVGITDYLSPAEQKAGAGLRGLTWPAVLQKNGYRTALIGKWHLGDWPEFHPTKLGFDHFMGFLGGGATTMDPVVEVQGKTLTAKGPTPDVLTEDAIAFLKSNRDRPFSLSLHFREPHLPYGPAAEVDTAHYTNLDPTVPSHPGLDVAALKQSTKAYYGSVSSVDRNVGRLLQTLDELGLAQNTLVIFTSDHGYNEGRHGIKTKGNAYWMAGGVNGPTRPNMWDTSVLIPLVMRWPAVITPGRRIDDMVSNIDVFRTVLGALKVPVPANAPARGTDFSPLLRGQSIPARNVVYGQYDLHNNGLAYMRMIRTERHKLVRFFHAHALDEFYDLETDPDETRNLARGNRAAPAETEPLQQKLRDDLAKWMMSINDPLLRDPY